MPLFSKGLSRSQSSPSTREMTVRSNKLFEISRAMLPGVVSQLLPFLMSPEARVISISSLGCLATHSSLSAFLLSKMALRVAK